MNLFTPVLAASFPQFIDTLYTSSLYTYYRGNAVATIRHTHLICLSVFCFCCKIKNIIKTLSIVVFKVAFTRGGVREISLTEIDSLEYLLIIIIITPLGGEELVIIASIIQRCSK